MKTLPLALWGLGALGKPVLIEINKYLEQEDLSPAEKVHLALALLDIGRWGLCLSGLCGAVRAVRRKSR